MRGGGWGWGSCLLSQSLLCCLVDPEWGVGAVLVGRAPFPNLCQQHTKDSNQVSSFSTFPLLVPNSDPTI